MPGVPGRGICNGEAMFIMESVRVIYPKRLGGLDPDVELGATPEHLRVHLPARRRCGGNRSLALAWISFEGGQRSACFDPIDEHV